jgi:hypothetical protein
MRVMLCQLVQRRPNHLFDWRVCLGFNSFGPLCVFVRLTPSFWNMSEEDLRKVRNEWL